MRSSKFVSVMTVLIALSMFIGAEIATAEGNRLRASLSGDKEVGSPGDPDGSGTARIRLRPRAKRVCWRLTWQNISQPQAAHIHKGTRTESGDVVVNLFLEPQDGNEASGCEDNVRRRLIRRIKKHPRRFYVNVHTEDFPAGAIRGQLHR
jgi:hypothetical protein